ncbi:MAG: helix-turn-helix domain-containing protein [Microbacterium sp.]
MNIEDRLREIIREELAPVLAALAAQPRSAIKREPESEPAPLPENATIGEAFAVLRTEQQRAAFAAGLPPIVPGRWLSSPEAAEQLGIKPRTLEAWRSEGRGPAFRRFGKLVKYDRALIEEFLG